MGCGGSMYEVASRTQSTIIKEDTKQILNDYQRRIIQTTWRTKLCTDMTRIGINIFTKIYTIDPKIKLLFPFHDLPEDKLMNDRRFRGHASRFMQAIGAAVENVESWESCFEPMLLGLGRYHITVIGFKSEYFTVFFDSMVEVWQNELKKQFTGDVRESWTIVFSFIMEKLQEGYNNAAIEEANKVLTD